MEAKDLNNIKQYWLISFNNWTDLVSTTKILKAELLCQIVGPRNLAKPLLTLFDSKVADSFNSP